MPTISQLPSADEVSASDLIPVSQSGSTHSVSLGALLAQTQPAIIVESPSLLGRYSIGPGGPDTIMVGDGLTLNGGTLSSSSFNLGSFPTQSSLSANDQLVVTNAGTSQLVGLEQIRELFTAGTNITIDPAGVISYSGVIGEGPAFNLGSLPSVTTIAAGDLVGVNQDGLDHNITYANLLNGLTIDMATPAAQAADGDSFWVAQANNIMLRQTLGSLWPWIAGKLTSWRKPVVELSSDTTLSGSIHNNAVLICSAPISISAATADMGSGFACDLINASSAKVTFSDNVLTSNGANGLSPLQCGRLQCVTYSAGTMIFASIGVDSSGSATAIPGQPIGLTSSSVTSSSIVLAWSAPGSGGAVAFYSVQYRITGTSSWLTAGQASGALSFTATGLQAATSFDFTVGATNDIGMGPNSEALTVSTTAAGGLPGAPTSVSSSNIGSTTLTCTWTAPVGSGTGIVYALRTRVTGQSAWNTAISNLAATTFNLSNLLPSTSYDIQVIASTSAGSGPSSAVITVQTTGVTGSVTGITWNLAPTGTFAHGAGAIGVNVHVDPPMAPIQFGFSTSVSTPPTSWLAGVFVNSDLWGQYLATPATAGLWYAWAEGTDGSSPTVYNTPFSVT